MIRREDLTFHENDIQLAVNMIEHMETTLDVMYYLLDHKGLDSFVLVLISANNVNMHEVIQKEKRDTDFLFCLDEESGFHAVLCQETKVDGGYAFAERLTKHIMREEGSSIYCAELEVKTTKYEIKDIIFKVLDAYLTAKNKNKDGEINYKTIS